MPGSQTKARKYLSGPHYQKDPDRIPRDNLHVRPSTVFGTIHYASFRLNLHLEMIAIGSSCLVLSNKVSLSWPLRSLYEPIKRAIRP